MKKLILNWLFGTDDVKSYFGLLCESQEYCQKLLEEVEEHRETLLREQEIINITRKLIRICVNHGINIDEEIKQIEL